MSLCNSGSTCWDPLAGSSEDKLGGLATFQLSYMPCRWVAGDLEQFGGYFSSAPALAGLGSPFALDELRTGKPVWPRFHRKIHCVVTVTSSLWFQGHVTGHRFIRWKSRRRGWEVHRLPVKTEQLQLRQMSAGEEGRELKKGFGKLNIIQKSIAVELLPFLTRGHHLMAAEQDSRLLLRGIRAMLTELWDFGNLSSILEILQTVLGSTCRLGPQH